MISSNTIDQIFSAADIKAVVSDFVSLKKAGVNFTGLCPFHNEKTPSFVVSPVKGIYKCFGCGKGGNAVNFVMDHEHKNYPEALKYLADKFNVTIEEDKTEPKDQKTEDLKEQLIKINALANDYFRTMPGFWEEQNAVAAETIQNRFTRDEVLQWQIGFIPDGWDHLLKHLKEKGVKEEFLLKSNLIKQSEKNHKLFDYFRGRIIFPILNTYGRPIAFGGRVVFPDKEGQKQPKYLNSPDSLLYDKSRTLYGINFARKAIVEQKICYIVEGYTDVISMHTAGLENTVAPCGTSLTNGQLQAIRKLTDHICFVFDNDAAGFKALIRSGEMAAKLGMIVSFVYLPDGEDPDSFCRNSDNNITAYLKSKKQDFISWYADDLLEDADINPIQKNFAIQTITELLSAYKKTTQSLYIDQISKKAEIKAKLFRDELSQLENIRTIEDEEKEWLPKGVDPNEFEKWGFYSYKNEYYFRTRYGNEKLSNFILKSVFHIDSVYDSKRIFEMINTYGHRVIINLDMNEITSLQAFQRHIESKGNFMFWGQMPQMQKLKLKLYEETRTCKEIENLGWQKEGFWAWANGYTNPNSGEFEEIDEYGVISYDKQDYFIPAFSKIYIKDKSIFIDERKFRYMKSKIELSQWMDLFLEVHGENAMIGFAFYLAAIFRDHILYLNDNFPLLNLYGQRGSGKNTLAYSLLALFGKKQTEFNIHNGTKPGLAKHLEMNNNAIAFIDEYKNSLDFDKIETLKSIYNAIGRSRMNMDKGMKKETTEVNQAVILAGQEMPTVDPALSTRTIFLQFDKKESLSADAKNKFKQLQEMERDGLPHFTAEFITHRKYFIEHYKENYEYVIKELTSLLMNEELDDRLVRNMTSVIAAFKTLESKFKFSFNYSELLLKGFEITRDHGRQLKKSDEIGIFWNLLEAMFDDEILINKWHFKLGLQTELKTNRGQTMKFPDGKRVLEFKFNSIAKLYAEHIRKRGEKPLPQDSLEHYLKTNKHFLCIRKSSKFTLKKYDSGESKVIEQKQTTTAFCFDYDKLNINLDRDPIESYGDSHDIKPIDRSESEFEFNEVPKMSDDQPF